MTKRGEKCRRRKEASKHINLRRRYHEEAEKRQGKKINREERAIEKNQIEYGEIRVIEKKRRKFRKEGFRGDFGIEERKREIGKEVKRKKRRERESEYEVGAMCEIKLEKERERKNRERNERERQSKREI